MSAAYALSPKILVHESIRSLRMLHGYGEIFRFVALMTDYTAFLDASGTDRGQPVLGFCGFLSTAHEWAKFSRRWAKALQGPPALPYFHMARFLAGRGKEGCGWWTDEERANLIARLVKAILDVRPLFAFGCTLDTVDYEAVFSEEERNAIGTPDVFCLPQCFKAVMDWLPRALPANEQVGFIFDQDNCDRMLYAADAYWKIKAGVDTADRMGTIQFASKKRHLPLQAADILVHQVFQAAKIKLVRQILIDLLENIPERNSIFYHFNRPRLIELRADITSRRLDRLTGATRTGSPK